jgi:hypothetical protein
MQPGPDGSAVPGTILQRIQSVDGQPAVPPYGTVIEIVSVKSIDRTKSYMDIYDAVGNVVRDNLPVYASNDRSRYYLVWSGINREQRIVGSGSYVGMIHIQDLGGMMTVKKQKIGVKR